MAVKKPDTQPRERYLRQQLREVHELIDGLRGDEKGKERAVRELPPLYIRAHKLRDMLDEELQRLAAAAGDEPEEMSPEELEAALVETLSELPQDMRRRICDRALGGPGLTVVSG